ncbi:MAG: glycosyltransferase [Planctomycetaceae bacterium]
MEPCFTIVVPTRNRLEPLRRLLGSLCALEYPVDRLEVIVVWDTGDANPDDVVEQFRGRLDVSSLESPYCGPGPARQCAIERARGDFVAFIDDDCEPHHDWLRGFARAFETGDALAVGGKVRNRLTDNVFASASQLLIDFVYSFYNADPADAWFFTTNNAAVSADGLRRMGGFDRDWCIAGAEDRDFWMRWRQAGLRMLYDPRIVVEHSHAMSWGSFLSTHYRYGQGAYYFHRRYALARSKSRRFFAGLPGFVWRSTSIARFPIYLALAGCSQVASGAGFLREWVRKQPGAAASATGSHVGC